MAKNTAKSDRKKQPSTRKNTTSADVRIRMYRQGLGDCFLLTFRQSGQDDFNMVIDCGVLNGSPNGSARIKQAVEDIEWETNSHLNLLVATHEHADHLSGFNQARDLWSKFTIDKTWLPWTENETDPAVKQLKNRQKIRLKASLAGWTRMKSLAIRLAADGQAKLEGRAESIRSLLDFSLEDGDEVTSLIDPSMAGAKPTGPARALAWLKEQAGSRLEYCHPTDPPRRLWAASDVRVFVLGPPEGPTLRRSDPKRGEAYEMFGGIVDNDICFGLAAADDPAMFGPAAASAAAQPFDAFHQRRHEDVRNAPFNHADGFFDTHYGFDDGTEQAWRRIDFDWLDLSQGLALALTGHINNTSLVLAFELGEGGPVLLFPGDAQAGSWLSWNDLKWDLVQGRHDNSTRTVTGADLLRRTVFYKVGHHGSHNATMRDPGLESMTSQDLVAFIPVHQATAQCRRPMWKMPWEPLWRRLQEKAEHRVILSDHEQALEEQLKEPAALAGNPTARKRWKKFQQAIHWDHSPERLWVEYQYTRGPAGAQRRF